MTIYIIYDDVYALADESYLSHIVTGTFAVKL